MEKQTVIIEKQATEDWLYYHNRSVEKPPIAGKYLFFSDDKQALIKTGLEIMALEGLPQMKVPATDTPNSSPGFGFVLCIYAESDALRYKLKQYATEQIAYRYWKAEALTSAAVYSPQFAASERGREILPQKQAGRTLARAYTPEELQ